MSRDPVFENQDHPRGGRTSLDSVLPLVVTTLSRHLIPDDGWKQWANVIKDYDEEPKYRVSDIRMLEREKDPVQSMWSGLTMDARDLQYVKETLTKAALYQSADFISVNVLKGAKVQRSLPVAAPAAPVQPVFHARPQGELYAPPTAVLESAAADYRALSTSSGSYGPRDYSDGTPVEYNGQMSDREMNIETSGEIENPDQEPVLYHRFDIRQEEASRPSPVYGENNLDENPLKDVRQENIIRKIQDLVNISVGQLEPGKPYEFQYEELSSVTQDFDMRPLSEGGRFIGRGGFGDVFLGLMHGKKIAVKRIKNEENRIVSGQFKAEIDAMSWLVHDNLLPLLGYCSARKHLCIVYEYISRGSLEDAIACKNSTTPLSIKQRLNIAHGSAKGIEHLHSRDPPLVHRDIKSANVLLSDDLTPKVGDFGLARLGPQPTPGQSTCTHIFTKDIIGTTAYMPPEAYSGEIATRWDCYSLGVVLQELVTGLPAYDETRKDKLLPYHIFETCDDDGEFFELTDSKAGTWSRDLVNKLYRLINNCLHERKRKRWDVKQIREELSSILQQA